MTFLCADHMIRIRELQKDIKASIRETGINVDKVQFGFEDTERAIGFTKAVKLCEDLLHKNNLKQVKPLCDQLKDSQKTVKDFTEKMGALEREYKNALKQKVTAENLARKYHDQARDFKLEKEGFRGQLRALEARYAGARL